MIPQWLRRLRRPAGLALAAGAAVVMVGGVHWYERGGFQVLRDVWRGVGGERIAALPDHPWESLLFRGEISVNTFLRKHGRPAPSRPDMVFLGVDDASLQLDGAWPEEIEASPALKLISQGKGAWNWSREVYAMLLDRLMEAGARLVMFDMIFPKPNVGDEAFRAAVDRYRGRVIVASQIIGAPGRGAFQQPADTIIADAAHDPRVGYASYMADFDNVTRKLTFFITQEKYNDPERPRFPGDVVYPSLLTCALRQLGRGEMVPADGEPRFFRFTDLFHRADYPPHSLWEVFSDATWKANYQEGKFFKDKIVIVGASAPTFHDILLTPSGDLPGPDLHLEALTAALNRDYLTPTSPLTNAALIVGAGVLAWVVGLAARHPLERVGASVAVSAGYGGVMLWLYNHFGLLPLAFTPLLTFNAGGLTGLIGEYVVERAEKARVRGVLDRLVSKDIVRELLSDRERYAQLVRGQRKCVTVLFSDVRGFTTLSEGAADPAAFIAQLNEYLGEMVEVVFKHRGTLDKFIGDAVMAVWGSMHTEGADTDARQAVAAALEMRERLAALNARWTAEGKLTLAIGIGVNFGEVIVGGLGSENSKLEITVMGDAVNTASRLEGLTKDYGLDLLVGESVAQRTSEVFRLRTVDLVRVKGKKKPTEVMTVIGPLSDVPAEEREEMLADYEDAILLYRRRDFGAAAGRLESCLRVDPDDHLAALYLERCRELLEDAPPTEWDGVRLMTTK